MSDAVIIALFTSLSGIIAAFGIPKIIESWRAFREVKIEKLQKQLEIETQKRKTAEANNRALEKQLLITETRVREFQIRLSVIIPIAKLKVKDPELIELLKLVERGVDIDITPAPAKT